MKPTELAVETRNRTNAKAMAIQAQVIALLTPYVGKKVRKVSGHGGWVAALQPQLDALYESLRAEGVNAWLACDCSWLRLEVKASYPISSQGVQYVRAEIYAGKVDAQGVLVDVSEPVELRTDYTLAWVEQTQAEAYRLESEARTLRSALAAFDR